MPLNTDFSMLLDQSQASDSVFNKFLQGVPTCLGDRMAFRERKNMRLIVSQLRYIMVEAVNRRIADGRPDIDAARPRG